MIINQKLSKLQESVSNFHIWMNYVQIEVENVLRILLPEEDTTPTKLHQAMRYAVLDGGKRIRSLLLFASGELFLAPSNVIQRAAAAVEMIHAYSLVHDDMPCMDDSIFRRGKSSVHIKYDEATALLVGDALQAQAFILLAEACEEVENERQIMMIRLLAKASGSLGMCGGQAIDLASIGLNLSLLELEKMHNLKTGSLLCASVLLGAWSGKYLTLEENLALEKYGMTIGLAFQVIDDILDATVDSAALGKVAGKDALNKKPTYVSILGLPRSQDLAKKLCSNAHQTLAIFKNKACRLHNLADLIVQRKA